MTIVVIIIVIIVVIIIVIIVVIITMTILITITLMTIVIITIVIITMTLLIPSTPHPHTPHSPHLHPPQPVALAQQPARATHVHRRHHLVPRHQPLPNPARAEELALNPPMKRTCIVSATSSCRQSSIPLTPRTEYSRSTSDVLRHHSPRELHGRDALLPRFQTDLRGMQLRLQFPPFRLLQTTKRQHQRTQSS